MKLRALLFVFATFLFSASAFSADCVLEKARVGYSGVQNGIQYYWVGNLDKQIVVAMDSATSSSELANLLKASDTDSGIFLDLVLDEKTCSYLSAMGKNVYTLQKSIKRISKATNKKVDCVDCVRLENAPIAITMPVMSEMKTILDKAAGFTPEKVNMTADMIVRLFERMNTKTPNANGVVFLVSIFRAFDLLGLKQIDRAQLEYLTATFKDKLPTSQYALLKKIFAQVDSLAFNHNKDGALQVSLRTVGNKAITIKGSDIPTMDNQTKQMMEKYFDKIEIEDNTSMSFADSKIQVTTQKIQRNAGMSSFEIESISRPSVVTINGIKVSGQFPIVGAISVNPRELNVDIDQKTPVKANVGFKKGFVSLSYTFDLNN